MDLYRSPENISKAIDIVAEMENFELTGNEAVDIEATELAKKGKLAVEGMLTQHTIAQAILKLQFSDKFIKN